MWYRLSAYRLSLQTFLVVSFVDIVGDYPRGRTIYLVVEAFLVHFEQRASRTHIRQGVGSSYALRRRRPEPRLTTFDLPARLWFALPMHR